MIKIINGFKLVEGKNGLTIFEICNGEYTFKAYYKGLKIEDIKDIH